MHQQVRTTRNYHPLQSPRTRRGSAETPNANMQAGAPFMATRGQVLDKGHRMWRICQNREGASDTQICLPIYKTNTTSFVKPRAKSSSGAKRPFFLALSEPPFPDWTPYQHHDFFSKQLLRIPSCSMSTFQAAQSGQHCFSCLVRQSVCSTA